MLLCSNVPSIIPVLTLDSKGTRKVTAKLSWIGCLSAVLLSVAR